jgi:chromosome segregation ATPase
MDVTETRKSKLGQIDSNIDILKMSAAARKDRVAEIEAKIASVKADATMAEYDRDAKVLRLNEQIKSVKDPGDLSEEARDAKVQELTKTRQKAEAFYSQLPMWRNIDRVVMIAVFGFFSALVWIAWKKRAAEGRI